MDHLHTVQEKSIILQLPFHDNSNGQPAKSLIPISDMISKKFYCPEAFLGKENLYKVLYTADRDKLLPRIVTGDKLQFALAIGNIGIYKNIIAFQQITAHNHKSDTTPCSPGE
jgi:hypothetical protein